MRLGQLERQFAPTDDGTATSAPNGMVASAFPNASRIGAEILDAGGNAADAAAGVGLALGVCEPQGSGLGGQTLAVCHFAGRTFALDGSSRAPSLAHMDQMRRGQRRVGYRATTVPSTPATLAYLQRTYGRLPWHDIVEPVVALAGDGYEITRLQHDVQERERERFLRVPSQSGARYFLGPQSTPLPVGAKFRQPDLAATLDEISSKGVNTFYHGEIAAQIDSDMRANNGFLRADDLALIPWPVERPVLRRRYRRVTVATMPPPGAGRILLLVMMMLGSLRSSFLAVESPMRAHFLAETFRKAFLRRIDRPFDPNTYQQVRDKQLLSRKYAQGLAQSIADGIDPGLPVADPLGSDLETDADELDGETTHFSVMDSEGGVVAATQSIELVYGSKAAADGLGFLYNNYLLAYETKDPSHPYFMRPNAIPWSSAAPTIVFSEGEPWMALGSPGSERIFSTLAQFLCNVVDRSMPLDEAMRAPRLHCSIGGRVSLEADRFDSELIEYLGNVGYEIDRREAHAFYLGSVQAVARCRTIEGFQGVADMRRDGAAVGGS